MVRLKLNALATPQDAWQMLQTAIGVEFGTLPPYLYCLYSIKPATNAEAAQRIRAVALQEMIHMCLACNILNALGGTPQIQPQTYPNPLPGDIGPNGTPLQIHLYPFSRQALQQAMDIEQPEDPPDFPVVSAREAAPAAVTIGQFYGKLDEFLSQLPGSAWTAGRNQLADSQFFAGQVFAVNNYADAHRAIQEIVSEGEGSRKGTVTNPLDFQDEVAHYFRFGEVYHNRVLTKADNPEGYAWGPAELGVDWNGAYPAVTDPGAHDFSQEPDAVKEAQASCNAAFSAMVDALQAAVNGKAGALGQAVQAMFHLRMAAKRAFTIPLADDSKVAGPAFLYTKAGGNNQ